MKCRWTSALLAALLAAGLLSACSLLPSEEAAPPPIIPAEEVSYNTVEVQRGDIANSVSFSGSLTSPVQHNLSFEKRGGYLTELAVRSGARVQQGDILAAIDTEALQQQVDEQRIALRIAQINYNEALEYARGDTAQPSVQRAQASLDLAWIQLRSLEEEFEASVIRAPIDGLITYAAALKVGDLVPARSTVFTLSDDSQMVVIVTGGASSLTDFALDMEVRLEYRREEYTGVVTMTPADAPADAFYTGGAFALVEFVELPEEMTIGHTVRVFIEKEVREDTVLVPVNAVTQYGSYAYVRVLEDGVSHERPVQLGITTATQAEILDGLQPGELVIVR